MTELVAVPRSELPLDIQQFLREQIRSIEKLEILLLLHNAPDRWWNVAEVYEVVRSSERSVSATLEALSKEGLLIIADDGSHQFSPKNQQLRDLITRLGHFYAERRVRIVEALYLEKPSEADEFAKAFRLRKDNHG